MASKKLRSGTKSGKRAAQAVVTYASPAILRRAIESAANDQGLLGDDRTLAIEACLLVEAHRKEGNTAAARIMALMVKAFGKGAKQGTARKPSAEKWAPIGRAVRKVSKYAYNVLCRIGKEWWGKVPHKGTGTGGVKGQNEIKTLRGLSSKLEHIAEYLTKKGFKETCPQDVYARFVAIAKEAAALRKLVDQRKTEAIETRDAEKAAA